MVFKTKAKIEFAYLFSLFVISLSFFLPEIIYLNAGIALLALTWLIEGSFAEKLNAFKKPLVLGYVSLFCLYLISLVYTHNLGEGLKDIESKLTLLLFPIILSTINLKQNFFKKTLLFFAYCCVFFSFITLCFQIKVSIDYADTAYLFSDGLVLIYKKQAIYYSIYVVFSIFILSEYLFKNLYSIGKAQRILLIFSIAFLIGFLFLLMARTSIGIFVIISLASIILIGLKKRRFKEAIIICVSLFLFFIGFTLLFPQTLKRFESLQNASFDFENMSPIYHFAAAENSEKNWNGLNLRLAKWQCAVAVIKDQPLLGVGTGDVKDELVEEYKRNNFHYAVEHRFDPHNQFLETTVAIGVIGLFALLFCYLCPLTVAIRKQNWLLGSFMILIVSSSLTESILGRSQGIVFISFFILIIYRSLSINGKLKQSSN